MRFVRHLALCFVLLGVAAPACLNRGLCTGAPTCFGGEASQCQHVPGCAPTPGCVLQPILGVDCTSPPTEAACLKSGFCAWTSAGCREACGAISDRTVCEATTNCLWSACTGLAKACRLYPVDACPVSPTGCFVDSND
jgi:hypothetical protein